MAERHFDDFRAHENLTLLAARTDSAALAPANAVPKLDSSGPDAALALRAANATAARRFPPRHRIIDSRRASVISRIVFAGSAFYVICSGRDLTASR